MIWEKIQELVKFHSQSLNVPIETVHLSDTNQSIDKFEGIQVLFTESAKEPTISSNSDLLIGFPLEKDNLPAISKALENHLPALARQYHKKQRDQLKKLVLTGVAERKELFRQSIKQAEQTLNDLDRQYFEATRQKDTDKHLLTQLEKPIIPLRKKIVKEYGSLKKLVPGMYRSIRFDNSYIFAATHQINIWYNDEEYEIGELLIELDLSKGQLRIRNLTDTVNGYHHPHVNCEGEVCLGNISSGISQLLGEFEIYGVLELLHKFIREYNEDDPHQKIQFWKDPDFCEDDNAYERCREGGSYGRTCLDCGDNDCPFFDGALEECQEYADFEKCIACSEICVRGEELLEQCHNENPLGCMTCSFGNCMFYRGAESCHKANAQSCSSCNIEHCKYKGVADESVAA